MTKGYAMPIEFRIKPHTIRRGVTIVEIVIDGKVVGAIYPGDGKEIRVVSAHIEKVVKDENFKGEVVEDDGSCSSPPIPHLTIRFEPSLYRFSTHRLSTL